MRRPAALAAALFLANACAAVDAPDLPLTDEELAVFWENTDWRPTVNAPIDVTQAAPSRFATQALSATVGQVKVIVGDDTNVSTVGEGFGLRMDQGRQDLARVTSQVIDEEGDHFDFVVIFPTFPDAMNAGFAYFTRLKNDVQGLGINQFDASHAFGSQGRLQGALNMNRPGAYTGLDGRAINDAQSAVFPVMGQELTHRWLAHARFRQDGGAVMTTLLGRDTAHWSALMHSGFPHPQGGVAVSVQDGVAWTDNGNGTFTVAEAYSDNQHGVTARGRFSPLDLYLMGLGSHDAVEPFFLIENARVGNQAVGPADVLTRGLTVHGTRRDIAVEDIIAAEGWRNPSVATSPKRFNLAIVLLTAPGETVESVQALATEVDGFRTLWEQRFSAWTGGVGSVCTRLDGCPVSGGGGGAGSSSSSSSSSSGAAASSSSGGGTGSGGGGGLPPGTTTPPNNDGDNGCSCGPEARPGADTALLVFMLLALRRRKRWMRT